MIKYDLGQWLYRLITGGAAAAAHRMLGLVLAFSAPAIAHVPDARAITCPSGRADGECRAAFAVDLDGDRRADKVELTFDPRLRLYRVYVRTDTGREFRPFGGGLDPRRDRVGLASRTGGGDPRCRSWQPGRECGYPVTSHDVPDTVLYLSDSRRGDFVLYIPQAYGTDHNRAGEFLVMPALDPPPARPPTGKRR